jgi:hypothetical protein
VYMNAYKKTTYIMWVDIWHHSGDINAMVWLPFILELAKRIKVIQVLQ